MFKFCFCSYQNKTTPTTIPIINNAILKNNHPLLSINSPILETLLTVLFIIIFLLFCSHISNYSAFYNNIVMFRICAFITFPKFKIIVVNGFIPTHYNPAKSVVSASMKFILNPYIRPNKKPNNPPTNNAINM